MGTLSEKLITQSKAEAGRELLASWPSTDSAAFNPAPFMQTFSPALDALLALRAQVAEQTKTMEGDVRLANREYGKRLRELDGGFEVSSLVAVFWALN